MDNGSSLQPWQKWRADLSGTRVQMTYAIMGIVVALFVRGMWLASTVGEIVDLINAANYILVPILVAWGWGKWQEGRNGKPNGG